MRSIGSASSISIAFALLFAAIAPPFARAQDKIDRLYLKAHAAFDAQDYGAAIDLWSEVIKLEPKDATARFNRSLAYEAKGDIPNAIADCDEAIRLDPTDAETFDQRSRLYSETAGKEREAKKPFADDEEKAVADCTEALRLRIGNAGNPKAELEKWKDRFSGDPLHRVAYANEAVKLDPKDADAWFDLANAEKEMGNLDKAITDCDQSVQLDPANPLYHEARGNAHLEQSGSKYGSELYNKALVDYAESLRLSLNGVKDPKAWLKQKAQDSAPRPEKFACAEALVKLDPKDPEGYEMRASLRIDIAAEAPGHDSFRLSVDDFHEAYKLKLQAVADPKAWFTAQISKDLNEMMPGTTDEAMAFACCEALIDTNPKDPGVWITTAASYAQFNQKEKAIANYTEAIRHDPKSIDAYKGRASVYAGKQEDAMKAVADCDTIIQLTPANTQENAGAHFMLADIYSGSGDYKKAVEELTSVLAYKKSLVTYSARAIAYMKLGDWDNAYADYSGAIQVNPDWGGEPYIMRAVTSYHRQDWDKVIADLDTAVIQYNKTAQKFFRGRIPKDLLWYEGIALRACVSYHMKQWGPALQNFSGLIETAGDHSRQPPGSEPGRFNAIYRPQMLKGMAWIFATCPDNQVRNGAKAVDLAMELCALSQWTDADDIDTLAASLAETGKWDDAVNYENMALQTATAAGADKNRDAIIQFTSRLDLYQRKTPSRQEKDLFLPHAP